MALPVACSELLVTKPTLSPQQRTILEESSRAKLASVFEHLRAHLKRQRWIGNNNTYRKRVVDALKRDSKSGATISHSHLNQYIAASAPLHCADGWSYLGRAIQAHVRGDADAARHLGYYSELRAAVSILASEGVGVFNRQHFVVDSDGICRRIPNELGTHVFTSLALEHWANQDPSADLLGVIVAPGGVSLPDWLEGFQAKPNLYPIGTSLLKAWGIDLRRLADDRADRNEASYRPTGLSVRDNLTATDCCQFLRELWWMMQPSAESRFEILDRHLLREILGHAFKSLVGKTATDDPAGFRDRVVTMVEHAQPSGMPQSEWVDFLTRLVEPKTPQIILEASGRLRIGAPKHHLQVLARATLLLRVAAGASSQLLGKSSFGSDELEFWWKPLGEARGLWPPDSEPDEIVDLWADVEQALVDLQAWADTGTSGQLSHWDLATHQSPAISVLSGCERIALWGLGL